jgi:hypothetical protein
MDLHKIGIKFFAGKDSSAALLDFIPVFHHWIQNRSLDLLLIDVADYSHVEKGPGTLLVAHEGNFGIDETGGRRGLAYYSKHELPGDLKDRIRTVAVTALKACRLLEQDESINKGISFPGNELQIFSNDRLLAPNTDEAWSRLEPVVREFLDDLYAGQDYSINRENDPRERLQVTVKVPEPVSVDTLLKRLGA